MNRLKIVRIVIPVTIVLLAAIAYIAHFELGTLSSFGWSTISIICPLGAVMAMLGAKTLIPRAIISLVATMVLVFIFGRAFCAWVCPVPVMQKLRDLVARITKEGIASGNSSKKGLSNSSESTGDELSTSGKNNRSLPVKNSKKLEGETHSSCTKKRGAVVDSRHIVLGGSLLTALIFGFPVFCLICPIGLTFGSIFLLVNLFGSGDVTWSVIAVPLILLLEIVLLRKWCGKFCPLSAVMSLLGKPGRFFRPKIDNSTCQETTTGEACGKCGKVCPEMIDPRHPDASPSAVSECTKCLACVKSCPTASIKLPFWPPKDVVSQNVDSSKDRQRDS